MIALSRPVVAIVQQIEMQGLGEGSFVCFIRPAEW
jgi:hypothetical protein